MQMPHAETAAPSTEFTPMPLRARGVLEMLDLAIKVFRRYAGVLLAWSALVIGICGTVGMFGAISAGASLLNSSASGYGSGLGESQVASLMLSSLGAMALSFFCFPLIIGASACCVAGAVRGQRIKFSQCWSFSRPRYWSMLGQTLLATIMLWIAMIGVFVAVAIVIALSVTVVTQLPGGVAIPLGIIAAVCFYAAFFVIALLAGLWIVMVPVVVCMEENNRSSNSLTRALALLRGNWRRAAGLMLLVWLGMLVISGVSQAPFAVLMGGARSAGSALIGATFVVQMLFWLCAMPFYTLLVTLFYLDARVRNEALDLEWTSHTGTPQETPNGATSTNFYPPVARAVSPADEQNIARPNESVWSAPAEDLATMPLSAFTPQRIAPAPAPNKQIAVPLAPTNQASNQTQPLAEFSPTNQTVAVSNDTQSDRSSTRSEAVATPAPISSTPFESAHYEETTLDIAEETCPQCGNAVSATQSFCMNCGARLSRHGGDFSTGFGT